MLPDAEGVNEFHVNHFGPLLAGHLYHAFGCVHTYLIFSYGALLTVYTDAPLRQPRLPSTIIGATAR
jgi:hypothetical protein